MNPPSRPESNPNPNPDPDPAAKNPLERRMRARRDRSETREPRAESHPNPNPDSKSKPKPKPEPEPEPEPESRPRSTPAKPSASNRKSPRGPAPVPEPNAAHDPDPFAEHPGLAEDVAVDNAPVLRMTHRNLTVEGYSRAAVQTYWRVPELRLGFDLGLQPWSFMTTPNWFVSHTHLDHIAALPVYVSRRRLMKMEPPRVFLPRGALDGAREILHAYRHLDRGPMPVELVGLGPGEEIELSRELVVTTFPTVHTIPSLGFVVWERRRKLRDEYKDLSGDQIRDLRLSGVEVAREIRVPRVAYTGDTAPAGLDAAPEIYDAEILILEMSFVAPNERPERIHKYGHIHLDDVVARADRFRNQVVIASHFSTRLPDDQIRRLVARQLPESLRERLRVWL